MEKGLMIKFIKFVLIVEKIFVKTDLLLRLSKNAKIISKINTIATAAKAKYTIVLE